MLGEMEHGGWKEHGRGRIVNEDNHMTFQEMSGGHIGTLCKFGLGKRCVEETGRKLPALPRWDESEADG